MVTWNELTEEAPELAAGVRTRFDAFRHKTIATLRADGSPRISGIEVGFAEGHVVLGMMPGSVKALDVLRDPRVALHSGSADPPDDPTAWTGDAKLAGRVVEVTDPAEVARLFPGNDQPAAFFTLDIAEAVTTVVGDPPDHLVIESWSVRRGHRRIERK